MSVVETILVFVVIPLVITGILALLIWGPGAARAPRYRPGRDWPFEPVWYAPHPLAVQHPDDGEPRVRAPQLPPGVSSAPEPQPGTAPTAAGGARGTW